MPNTCWHEAANSDRRAVGMADQHFTVRNSGTVASSKVLRIRVAVSRKNDLLQHNPAGSGCAGPAAFIYTDILAATESNRQYSTVIGKPAVR